MSWSDFMTLGILAMEEGRPAAAAGCFRDAMLALDEPGPESRAERRNEARRWLRRALDQWARLPGSAPAVLAFRQHAWKLLGRGAPPVAAEVGADPRGAPAMPAPPPARRRPGPRAARSAEVWPPPTWSGCMEAARQALEERRPGVALELLERALDHLGTIPATDWRRLRTREERARALALRRELEEVSPGAPDT